MKRKPGRPPRADLDWRAITLEYRHGGDSIRQIAQRHRVSEAAIRIRAKEESWPPRLAPSPGAGRPIIHRGEPCPVCKRSMTPALAVKVAAWLASEPDK